MSDVVVKSNNQLAKRFDKMTEFLNTLNVALCQVQVGADKDANIKKIEEAISSTESAQLVVSKIILLD